MKGVEILGGAGLQRAIDVLEKEVGAAVKSQLIAAGKLVETEAKKLIAQPSFGSWVTRYRNGGAKYEHIASRPESPPNTDTGALIKSVQTEVQTWDVYVGTNLEYSKWLEFGTKKMEKRPFLTPAYASQTPKIMQLLERKLKQVIESKGKK
jgi:HK97 gp10 family phage protein